MTDPFKTISEVRSMIEAQQELNERFVAEYQRLMEIGDSLRKFNDEISLQLGYLHSIAGWIMEIMQHNELDYSNALNERMPNIYAIHDLLSKMCQERLPPI